MCLILFVLASQSSANPVELNVLTVHNATNHHPHTLSDAKVMQVHRSLDKAEGYCIPHPSPCIHSKRLAMRVAVSVAGFVVIQNMTMESAKNIVETWVTTNGKQSSLDMKCFWESFDKSLKEHFKIYSDRYSDLCSRQSTTNTTTVRHHNETRVIHSNTTVIKNVTVTTTNRTTKNVTTTNQTTSNKTNTNRSTTNHTGHEEPYRPIERPRRPRDHVERLRSRNVRTVERHVEEYFTRIVDVKKVRRDIVRDKSVIKRKRSYVDKHRHTVQTLKDKIKELEDKLKKTKDRRKRRRLTKDIEKVHKKVVNETRVIIEETVIIEKLEDTVKQKDNVEKVQSEVKKLIKDRKPKSPAQIKIIEKEIVEVEEEVTHKDEVITELRKKIEIIKSTVPTKKSGKPKDKDLNRHVKEQLQKITTEIKKIEKEKKKLRDHITDKTNKVKAYKIVLGKLQDIEEVTDKDIALEEEDTVEDDEDEVDVDPAVDLKKLVRTDEIQDLEKRIQSNKGIIEKSRTEKKGLESEIESITKDLHKLLDEIIMKNATQTDPLNIKADQLENKIVYLRNKIVREETFIEELEDENEDTETILESLKAIIRRIELIDFKKNATKVTDDDLFDPEKGLDPRIITKKALRKKEKEVSADFTTSQMIQKEIEKILKQISFRENHISRLEKRLKQPKKKLNAIKERLEEKKKNLILIKGDLFMDETKIPQLKKQLTEEIKKVEDEQKTHPKDTHTVERRKLIELLKMRIIKLQTPKQDKVKVVKDLDEQIKKCEEQILIEEKLQINKQIIDSISSLKTQIEVRKKKLADLRSKAETQRKQLTRKEQELITVVEAYIRSRPQTYHQPAYFIETQDLKIYRETISEEENILQKESSELSHLKISKKVTDQALSKIMKDLTTIKDHEKVKTLQSIAHIHSEKINEIVKKINFLTIRHRDISKKIIRKKEIYKDLEKLNENKKVTVLRTFRAVKELLNDLRIYEKMIVKRVQEINKNIEENSRIKFKAECLKTKNDKNRKPSEPKKTTEALDHKKNALEVSKLSLVSEDSSVQKKIFKLQKVLDRLQKSVKSVLLRVRGYRKSKKTEVSHLILKVKNIRDQIKVAKDTIRKKQELVNKSHDSKVVEEITSEIVILEKEIEEKVVEEKKVKHVIIETVKNIPAVGKKPKSKEDTENTHENEEKDERKHTDKHHHHSTHITVLDQTTLEYVQHIEETTETEEVVETMKETLKKLESKPQKLEKDIHKIEELKKTIIEKEEHLKEKVVEEQKLATKVIKKNIIVSKIEKKIIIEKKKVVEIKKKCQEIKQKVKKQKRRIEEIKKLIQTSHDETVHKMLTHELTQTEEIVIQEEHIIEEKEVEVRKLKVKIYQYVSKDKKIQVEKSKRSETKDNHVEHEHSTEIKGTHVEHTHSTESSEHHSEVHVDSHHEIKKKRKEVIREKTESRKEEKKKSRSEKKSIKSKKTTSESKSSKSVSKSIKKKTEKHTSKTIVKSSKKTTTTHHEEHKKKEEKEHSIPKHAHDGHPESPRYAGQCSTVAATPLTKPAALVKLESSLHACLQTKAWREHRLSALRQAIFKLQADLSELFAKHQHLHDSPSRDQAKHAARRQDRMARLEKTEKTLVAQFKKAAKQCDTQQARILKFKVKFAKEHCECCESSLKIHEAQVWSLREKIYLAKFKNVKKTHSHKNVEKKKLVLEI